MLNGRGRCGRPAKLEREAPADALALGLANIMIERAARILWESRPVAYYAWSGVEMQSSSTQIARSISALAALIGSIDRSGGNVIFPVVPSREIRGSTARPAALGVRDDRRGLSGEHGPWQACPEIGAPGYDPFSNRGSNYHLLIGNAAIDRVSGSVPHRAYVCQMRKDES